jgi:phosphoenolpyruvate-protein kinase (PTS system EI component)
MNVCSIAGQDAAPFASGVIVEVGGVLSHASTVAREYGIPALANVKHATKRLKTGERIRLDAIHGFVETL